ncbi:DUF2334 domain-containing protein [Nanoarchaeota archaeon]
MEQKYLTVSIHDVTPKFRGELSEIVSELDRRGVGSRSILVIPNYELQHDISQDDSFIAWLHQLREGGDELVHHGLEHVSRNRAYRTLAGWFMGEVFAQGCAEFQNTGYEEARKRIQRGREILQNAEISAEGFVAPAWLLNPDSERAVRDEGFKYTTYVNKVRIFSEGDVQSEVVGFASQPRAVDYVIRMYDLYLSHVKLRNRELARVAIHPQDMWGKGTFDYALKTIDQLMQNRTLVTYSGRKNTCAE